jgi:ArsR family transcriptional regulator
MTKLSHAEAAAIGKALGDPTRLGIFSEIAKRKELFCGELGACDMLSCATVSHHLRGLTQAGLIASRREGQFIYYRAVPERLAAYRRHLAELPRKGSRPRVSRNRR